MAPYLKVDDITKAFPGVLANDHVSLAVERGEIHGLVGENGAGKSTLMNMLYGMFRPDSGQIYLDGQPVTIPNPQTAIQLGIGMVHQHFQLVPSLTVAENVALGYEVQRGMFVDRAAIIQRVREISQQYGLQINPTERVMDLSVGEQQRVEIIKLLYRDAQLLILDEPSAVLTPQEVEDLFGVLRRLVDSGRTAIFITHKLNEIMALCQRATVLRGGRVVGTVNTADTDPAEIATMMVGRTVERVVLDQPAAEDGPLVLALRNIDALDERQLPALTDINVEVHAGEIVGLAGVEGNGQSELLEVLAGLRTPKRGQINLAGEDVTALGRRERWAKGMAVIPEDRNREGLSKSMAIWENIVSTRYKSPELATRTGVMHIGKIKAVARSLMEAFDVRAPNDNVPVGSLSGGNAQKVVIARELASDPKVLIAAQPTRGLDVGAARFVHEQLLALRAAGGGVLLVSADLDELLALSDRILVIYEGRIVGELSRDAATREILGLYMTGQRPQVTEANP